MPDPLHMIAMNGGIAGVHQFGYDVVEVQGRRKPSRIETRREDEVLNSANRGRVSSTGRDLVRNFAIAAFMLRKHLDFVSRFRLQVRTTDKGFNRDLQDVVEKAWATRESCDAAGRLRLSKLIRLAEAHRTIDGDVGLHKLRTGRVQMIEADRVRSPFGLSGEWNHGIKTGPAGRHLAYAVHRRRRGGGFEFEQEVPRNRMMWHAYIERHDQTRGISPLTSGLNALRDVYENFEYALAKAKLSQMMGVAITTGATGDDTFGTATAAESTDGSPKYKIDMGRAPWKIELDDGDDIKIVESQTPSDQFQSFHQAVVMVALKSLDLPYSFFDESHTNFHGSLRAAQLYMRSARDRIEDNQELLNSWLSWKLAVAIADGDFSLPSKWTAANVPVLWVPDGVPWWDKAKEIKGDRMAIQSGLDNPQRVATDHGTDFYDNIDRLAEAYQYVSETLGKYGFKLDYSDGPAITLQTEEPDA